MIKKNKKAAMEMSVGTIVTIVLLMAVLVLGLTLTKNIFRDAGNSINQIDRGVEDQINKLFSQDDLKKIAIYPGRSVSIKKGGDESGFAFSLRNLEKTEGRFSYEINSDETDCQGEITRGEALSYISLGQKGEGIRILSGNVMEYPELVKFDLPDNAPPCEITYIVDVEKCDSSSCTFYTQIKVYVTIISR
jgi:hypothetical protein